MTQKKTTVNFCKPIVGLLSFQSIGYMVYLLRQNTYCIGKNA